MRHLTLIGEKINYSIPRIGRLLDARDYSALREIARSQAEQGADYIDVNVGHLPVEVMAEAAREVGGAVPVPLCIDSTDPAMLEAGLEACGTGPEKAGAPVLNSVIEFNAPRVLRLKERFDCQVVLLVSERLADGVLERNAAADEAVTTAGRLFDLARAAGFGPGEIYIDPGTPPIASDLEGLVNTALETMEKIASDADMGKAHILIGLSNFMVGLPGKVKLPLQNAFLTLAMRNGLDTLIGDPARAYRLLETGDAHLAWLERILSARGAGRLEELTASPLYGGTGRDRAQEPPVGGEPGGSR